MVPTQEGAPFLTGRKKTECSKKRTHACQKQRNPRRSLAPPERLPFSLVLSFGQAKESTDAELM
jgi:hypothetical protein